MGHLVAGGSIANIEAIWVARNLKYYPLGLQEALLKEEQLRGARGYEVDTVIYLHVVSVPLEELFILLVLCYIISMFLILKHKFHQPQQSR